jgi:hypothetical protein
LTSIMQRLDSGEVVLTLRRRWSDGTFAKVFQPQDLIAKVLALLPAPGANLLRLHGQFAPGARWRALIVRAATVKRAPPPAVDSEEKRQRRMAWSVLLRRSFGVDVLECPVCGGRRELAVTEHGPTVQKILGHLGLPSELPAFAAPRGPPLFAGSADVAVDDLHGVDAERRVVADADFVEVDYG